MQNLIGQIIAQPKNVRMIADALELENERLEGLMTQYDVTLVQAGYDKEEPSVVAAAQEIEDLHTKIQELTDQYISLAGFPVPGIRGVYPRM